MIQKILLLSLFAVAYSQYRERAPPMREGPPPEEYAPEPQQRAPPPQIFNSRPPVNDVYKPASVHYVNIGTELAGDYKFGYDTGKYNDGQSFREETRLPDGTVQGAYGYVDETGRQRIVKYTAGKDGFKAEGDIGPHGAPKSPSRQAAPAPAQAAPAPPPPQQSYAPQPQPAAYRPPPQPVHRPPPPQPAYRPQPQPAYRAPPPQPAYRPPPQQPSYSPEPQAPRPRPRPRPRYVEPETPDYDYDPNNEITERRIVPIDTSLFNYNIGINQGYAENAQ